MASTKITGLTHSNVRALREAVEVDPHGFDLVLGATTAEFLGAAPAQVITWLDRAMAAMPTKGHPRASLHAVRRKLAAQVSAHEPLKEPLPAEDRFAGFTAEDRQAYDRYLSEGYGDTDGYWGPLHPQSWLAMRRPRVA